MNFYKLYICFAIFTYGTLSCSNCLKRFDFHNLEEKYCVQLNSNATNEDIQWRKRCTGYCFDPHPRQIAEKLINDSEFSCSNFDLCLTFIFDIKTEILYDLTIEDYSDSLSIDEVERFEIAFFKELRINYFNTFLNPIVKNVRGYQLSIILILYVITEM